MFLVVVFILIEKMQRKSSIDATSPTGGLPELPLEDYGALDDSGAIVYKSMNNILSDMNLDSKESIIIKNIILDLESQIGDIIFNDGKALIPYIGTINKPYKAVVARKYAKEFIEARKRMTKEEYTEYIRDIMKKEKKAIEEQYARATRFAEFRSKRFRVYTKLFDRHGEEYANVWLFFKGYGDIVHFDPDREAEYQQVYAED